MDFCRPGKLCYTRKDDPSKTIEALPMVQEVDLPHPDGLKRSGRQYGRKRTTTVASGVKTRVGAISRSVAAADNMGH